MFTIAMVAVVCLSFFFSPFLETSHKQLMEDVQFINLHGVCYYI